MGIKVEKGNQRINELSTNQNTDWKLFKNKFVVNQTFLDAAGIKLGDTDNQPLIIRHGNKQPGPIIGVVDDFHFESLHDPIRPLIFEFTPVDQWGNAYMFIKINAKNIPATIHYVKEQWEEVAEGLPFNYYFLDEEYNALYKSETQTGNLFLLFTVVSLFIIVIGLLGLIAFVANQKTKEIGIRKVLGASIGNILFMLSKKFMMWILFANIIAWPVAYYFMNKWLQDFAYRIDLSWWIFVLSAGIVLVIALATVSFQAIKAATENPVDALRYE
jgi:putative ABC transport system permease protein